MKRRLRNQGEEGYWKSFTDIMAGLLLIILLILMLLMLYMAQMNREEHLYDYQYEHKYDEIDDSRDDSDHRKDYDHQYDEPPQSGGGGGVDDPGDSDNDGIYWDVGHDKTAVFVTIVDEETDNVIKKEGVLFELYADKDARGGLCVLHTYYPEKIEYKQYQTTPYGTFYLPEKISNGWYSLHNLKAPEGYGLAEDVSFEITESLDWSEPYMVKVALAPEKGVIRIHSVDAKTNASVGGVQYEVYAAENVITLDGTVRYKKGEKVNSFTCDEAGKGESKKLYLGKYTVKQTDPAAYYALNTGATDVELTDELDDKVYTVRCEKTTAVMMLTDEYSEQPISDAIYNISGRGKATTDEAGKAEVTDFDKNTTYKVTLESVPEPYRISSDSAEFTVDEKGLVEDKAVVSINQTAYVTRLSVDVRDLLFGRHVRGREMQLIDSAGVVIQEWDSADDTYMIEGLDPGEYTLTIKNIFKETVKVYVKDSAKPVKVVKDVWTWLDTFAVVSGLGVLAAAVWLLIKLIRRKKAKKADEKK